MEKEYSIKNVKNFSIKQIAESGQTFRWSKTESGSYIGIAFGKIIEVIQNENNVIIKGSNEEEYINIWKEYFDFNRDYGEIKNNFKNKDIYLDNALDFGDGIRILNQDLFETIISFIISANNNIPRIKKTIELIAKRYGKFIRKIGNIEYYSFPTPEELSLASVEELRECGLGYRDSYIYKTTKMILKNEVNLEQIKSMNFEDSKIELKKLVGIGDKVADCILLFSCNKSIAFPVDTWVKKILSEYYSIEKPSIKYINKFAREYFGEHCGIAQQYLFYYIRNLN